MNNTRPNNVNSFLQSLFITAHDTDNLGYHRLLVEILDEMMEEVSMPYDYNFKVNGRDLNYLAPVRVPTSIAHYFSNYNNVLHAQFDIGYVESLLVLTRSRFFHYLPWVIDSLHRLAVKHSRPLFLDAELQKTIVTTSLMIYDRQCFEAFIAAITPHAALCINLDMGMYVAQRMADHLVDQDEMDILLGAGCYEHMPVQMRKPRHAFLARSQDLSELIATCTDAGELRAIIYMCATMYYSSMIWDDIVLQCVRRIIALNPVPNAMSMLTYSDIGGEHTIKPFTFIAASPRGKKLMQLIENCEYLVESDLN